MTHPYKGAIIKLLLKKRIRKYASFAYIHGALIFLPAFLHISEK